MFFNINTALVRILLTINIFSNINYFILDLFLDTSLIYLILKLIICFLLFSIFKDCYHNFEVYKI